MCETAYQPTTFEPHLEDRKVRLSATFVITAEVLNTLCHEEAYENAVEAIKKALPLRLDGYECDDAMFAGCCNIIVERF